MCFQVVLCDQQNNKAGDRLTERVSDWQNVDLGNTVCRYLSIAKCVVVFKIRKPLFSWSSMKN